MRVPTYCKGYDYGFRHYDAQIGRFVQIDPLTDELAPLSGYHYAYNDPINHIDLDGLIGIPCPGTSQFTMLLQNIGQFIANQAPTVAAAFALNGSAALASGLLENGRQKSETKQAGRPNPIPSNMLGSPDYYRWRELDFKERHVGTNKKPPTYYLGYGYKYVKRFSEETYYILSPKGKKWLERTRKRLQIAIEKQLKFNPMIEESEEEFKKFAFDSHIDAYEQPDDEQNGVLGLGILDKIKILLTPDAKDLFSDDGRRQAARIALDQAKYYARHPLFAAQQLKEYLGNRKEIAVNIFKYSVEQGVSVNYPKEVLADQIYCTRENRKLLKEKDIHLVAKPLGRPSSQAVAVHLSPGQRNPVEGKFGQAKTAYGLNNIKAKLKQTSESWIACIALVLNLVNLTRRALVSLLYYCFYSIEILFHKSIHRNFYDLKLR